MPDPTPTAASWAADSKELMRRFSEDMATLLKAHGSVAGRVLILIDGESPTITPTVSHFGCDCQECLESVVHVIARAFGADRVEVETRRIRRPKRRTRH